jgi:hypothetical protein
VSTAFPRWVRALGQWLLCGLAGAALCLVAALVLNGTASVPALREAPAFGLEWGLIGGFELEVILWLFGWFSRGLRPGELILATACMCVLPTVLNTWLYLSLSRVLSDVGLWKELPFAHELRSASEYLNQDAVVALGALGGVIVAAASWGWPRQPRPIAARNAGLCALVTALIACLVLPGWSPLVRPARERARVASCMGNQKCLGLDFLMYANDYNDRLPPGQTSLELIGLHRAKYAQALAGYTSADPLLADPLLAAMGGGPMDGYSKNYQIWFCPSDTTYRDWRGRLVRRADPEPGVSYFWHASLAGRKVGAIPVPAEEWLMRDREPWHSGTRALVFADGHAQAGGR